MASLVSLLFNGGTNGSAVTAANSGATTVTASPTPLYTSTSPIEGALSVICQGSVGNCTIRKDFASQADAFASVYFIVPPTVTATMTILSLRQGTNEGASVRLQTDRSLQMRDGSVARDTATGALPAGALVRVDLKSTPTSAGSTACEMKVWVGSNANGTVTADYTKAGVNTSTAATALDNVTAGCFSTGVDLTIDRLLVDDTAYPTPMSSAAPTIDVHGDLVKDTGSAAFDIVAAYTIPSGRTLNTLAWTQSGTTTTVTGGTTDTLHITPPAGGGSTTYTCTVTDSLGGNASDSVTVSWVAPGQIFRPVADGAANSWTSSTGGALFSCIDEAVADTADFISSPDTPTGQEFKFKLSALPDPVDDNNVVINLGVYFDAAVTTQSTVVKLYDSDGTTVRKTVTWTDITSAPVVRQITLTSGEAGPITGWNAGLWIGIAPTAS